MTDFAPYQKLEFAFSQLLADLSKTWSAADIAYVRDLVTHAEYGEALENLIALGVNNGTNFDRGLMVRLQAIAADMRLDAAKLLASAKATRRPSAASAAA